LSRKPASRNPDLPPDPAHRSAEEEIRRVNAALLESEGRFKRLADATRDVIWITDLEPEKVVYASPSFERIWGRKVEDLYADPHLWIAGIHPEDRERIGTAFMAWIHNHSGRPWEAEFRVQQPNGGVRWIHERGAFISEEGGPKRVSGISTDITERRTSEAALRESEERFSLAVAGSADGIWDWDIVSDQMFMSERAQRLYGLEPGVTVRPRTQWLQMVKMPTDEVAARRQAIEDYVAGRSPVFDNEWRIRHPDGHDRWVRLRGMCVRDASGRATRFSGSITDIDVRKASEAALRESEERFALAVAGSNDGIWDWDIVTDEMFFSQRAQQLYGLEPGPTVRPRSEWRTLVKLHPDDVESQLRMVEGYLAGELPAYEGEWRVRHADGGHRWVRIRGLCVRDARGQATRMAGSVSDIDSQKRAYAALHQAQRLEAMGTLAGGIAHDFNNILGAILGFGQMSLRNTRPGSRLRRDLECILVAGERGRALVERILAFSRSGVSERVPVHVEGVVLEAMQLLSATLPDGVLIDTRLRAGQAALLGDATQVHQVFMNLATNAIQAMPSGGTLQVSLACAAVPAARPVSTGPIEAGDYIVLTVTDSGSGIAPDIRQRIFDPFFTTKDVGAGTGLGLSLVHGIVAELGGAIDVTTAVGSGSSFEVYLPRTGDIAGEPAGGEISATPRGTQQRVLVVDDEEALVRLTTELLGAHGYACAGYTSSPEALAAFRAQPNRFDAVITDERMPTLSGLAMVKALRGVRAGVPIIVMSGYLGDDLVTRALAAGATAVLGKPLNEAELTAALAQALGRSAAPRAARRRRARQAQVAAGGA
jgi:PAS domain S-box-containing protein